MERYKGLQKPSSRFPFYKVSDSDHVQVLGHIDAYGESGLPSPKKIFLNESDKPRRQGLAGFLFWKGLESGEKRVAKMLATTTLPPNIIAMKLNIRTAKVEDYASRVYLEAGVGDREGLKKLLESTKPQG